MKEDPKAENFVPEDTETEPKQDNMEKEKGQGDEAEEVPQAGDAGQVVLESKIETPVGSYAAAGECAPGAAECTPPTAKKDTGHPVDEL